MPMSPNPERVSRREFLGKAVSKAGEKFFPKEAKAIKDVVASLNEAKKPLQEAVDTLNSSLNETAQNLGYTPLKPDPEVKNSLTPEASSSSTVNPAPSLIEQVVSQVAVPMAETAVATAATVKVATMAIDKLKDVKLTRRQAIQTLATGLVGLGVLTGCGPLSVTANQTIEPTPIATTVPATPTTGMVAKAPSLPPITAEPITAPIVVPPAATSVPPTEVPKTSTPVPTKEAPTAVPTPTLTAEQQARETADKVNINIPNPEDVRLVREDLTALILQYPNLKNVEFAPEFLTYWQNRYGDRVKFDDLMVYMNKYSFADNVNILTAIELSTPDKPTYWLIEAMYKDGKVAGSYVRLSEKYSLHPNAKSQITIGLIRREALLKEVTSIRMAAVIYRNHNELSSKNVNEFGDTWRGAMVENASAAITADFLLKHRAEVPPEDLAYYDREINGLKTYSTQLDIGF